MDSYQIISRYYDLEHEDLEDDANFILSLVKNGPVLEVGSGTGRLTVRLAEAGFEVWGIDSSAHMMALARERLKSCSRVHLETVSLLDLDLQQRFAALLLPLNTLWHFVTADAQVEALRVLRKHSAPRALLVIDLSNPLAMADRGSNGEVRQRFDRQTASGEVFSMSASWDDQAEQVLSMSLFYDRADSKGYLSRDRAELELRYVYRNELELLLRLTRFQLLHVYGSYDLDPYESASPNLIAVAVAV